MSISNRYHWYLESIRSTPHSNPLQNTKATYYFTGVPGAISDVKGKMVYARTSTGLELAWEFEVEMLDNWYDVVISAHDSSGIFSVVDWIRDSPAPAGYSWTASDEADDLRSYGTDTGSTRLTERTSRPELRSEATYLVFPWGVNDPDSGERTSVTDLDEVDRTASRYGWHSIPHGNVPPGLLKGNFSNHPLSRSAGDLLNFTSTLGNNVFASENWTFSEDRDFVNKYRPSSPTLDFTYPLEPLARDSPEARLEEAKRHVNASITQIFYTVNKYHDLLYRYYHQQLR